MTDASEIFATATSPRDGFDEGVGSTPLNQQTAGSSRHTEFFDDPTGIRTSVIGYAGSGFLTAHEPTISKRIQQR